MSLLIWAQVPSGIVIASDTLALDATTHRPLMFVDKTAWMAHCSVAVAGTGSFNLLTSWIGFMRRGMIATNVDMVDEHTTDALRRVSESVRREVPGEKGEGTIFHFGWSPAHECHVRYAYRPENDFGSEVHVEGGLGTRPWLGRDYESGPDGVDFVGIAAEIKATDDAKPIMERVGIGGDLNQLVIVKDEARFERLHRFDDYDEAWFAINEQLS